MLDLIQVIIFELNKSLYFFYIILYYIKEELGGLFSAGY